MSDSLEILASGSHGTVASSLDGVTRKLDGFARGTIPLELQRKGSPVDTTAYTQAALTLAVTAMTNRHGDENGLPSGAKLHVTVEHLVGGRWLELHRFEPVRAPSTQEALVSPVGESVRASWYFARHDDQAGTINDEVEITWSLTAEAMPEAQSEA